MEPFKFYIDAFQDLLSDKTEGSPIPFTSIVEYFKIYGEGLDFEDFKYIIRRLDAYLIKHESEKIKKKQKSQGKNNGKPTANHTSKVRR